MIGSRIFKPAGHKPAGFALRRRLLLGLMLIGMGMLVLRAFFLQIIDTQYLQKWADRQHVGVVTVPAYRGKILDRNNEPLAISTPVESVWVNTKHFVEEESDKLKQVAKLLKLSGKKMARLKKSGKRFVYLRRRINPELALKIKALEVSGVYFEKEFKRFYPAGAVSAHVVGFTDVDDVGQEGMELGYEQILKGVAGKKRVIRDGRRQVIREKDIENIKDPVAGQDLTLSIDQRLQYLAFKELQKAVIAHKAKAASIVVLDAKNGEVLAAVNQPAFNPNTRKGLKGSLYRNRAMLDVFEPGSTVKPFVVAAALDGGYVNSKVIIKTHGFHRVGRYLVKDVHNYGNMDLMHVLKKSSNVAVSKIALKMPREYFWSIYNQLGFGTSANVGFPGEASGTLSDFHSWNDFKQATLSYGYAVSSSVLQLAKSYTALADDGILHSVSILKRDEDYDAKRVFTKKTAVKVREMLEHVIKRDGTAYQARVDGYRVAGKTGTVKKAMAGGYTEDSYLAVFVGMAPASDPRFVIAVMVDEPSAGQYYGGLVAAPVFSKVMEGALRVYGVTPDKEDTVPMLLTRSK